MSKFIVLIFYTALFFGCTDSLALKQKSGQDFILITKHPLISEKELLLESIIDLLDAGIVNQSSLSHIFSSSWVNNLRSNDPWFKNIKVEIEEYQPLAYWHGNSFLTQSGLIITPTNPSIDLDLITLEGEESYKYNLIDFSRKLQSLLIRINNNLHSLSLKNGYLKAITTEGLVIFFDFKEFRGQLERLEDLIMFELSSGNLENVRRLDFRYKNGVAVHVL